MFERYFHISQIGAHMKFQSIQPLSFSIAIETRLILTKWVLKRTYRIILQNVEINPKNFIN